MHWYVTVETEDGDYYCCVVAGSEFYAEKMAKAHYKSEGEVVISASAEMWNDYEHGSYNDYDIIE